MSQRPRVLIELGAELDRAAREAGHRRWVRVRDWPTASLSGVATLLAVGCTIAVAGFAIIALGHGRRSGSATAAKPGSSQSARRPAGDLRAWFAALRRPPAAVDRLPSQVIDSLTHRPHIRGVNIRSSRRVISTRDLQIWLVLARDGLCEVEVQAGPRVPTRTGFGVGCTTITAAESYGLVSTGKSFQALLPDGTSQVKLTYDDGSSTLLTPSADGVILYTPKRLVREYSFTSPTGARINHMVVIPPRPPHGSTQP